MRRQNDELWDYLVSLFEDEPDTVIEMESDDSIVIHRVLPQPVQWIDLAPDEPNTHYPFADNEYWN